MKVLQSIILIVLPVFAVVNCNGQTVPENVKRDFSGKFSNATNVTWQQEEPNEWEAEFVLNGRSASASFDNTGKWLETEMEVKVIDLPSEVHKAINLKLNGWEIEKAESVEKSDFKGFEIVLEKSDTEVEIVVSTAGDLTIEKVTVEDDDNDNGKENEDEDEGDHEDDEN